MEDRELLDILQIDDETDSRSVGVDLSRDDMTISLGVAEQPLLREIEFARSKMSLVCQLDDTATGIFGG
jgi:hypothetical protein